MWLLYALGRVLPWFCHTSPARSSVQLRSSYKSRRGIQVRRHRSNQSTRGRVALSRVPPSLSLRSLFEKPSLGVECRIVPPHRACGIVRASSQP